VTVEGAGPGFPSLSELAVEDAGRGYRHDAVRRVTGTVAVQVTLSGCGALWTDGARASVPLPRGTALIFRAGVDRVVYGLPPAGGTWRFVYANLRGAATLAMADDLIAAHGHAVAIDPQHAAVRALIALDAGRGRGDLRLDNARAARLACDLLLALAEQAVRPPDSGTVAARALAALARQTGNAQAVSLAAHEAGISREHFSRVFAHAYGESPAAWLRRRRIDQAAAMLADPDLPITEIARRCGFATVSHFTQAFRLARGVTPGVYRGGM